MLLHVVMCNCIPKSYFSSKPLRYSLSKWYAACLSIKPEYNITFAYLLLPLCFSKFMNFFLSVFHFPGLLSIHAHVYYRIWIEIDIVSLIIYFFKVIVSLPTVVFPLFTSDTIPCRRHFLCSLHIHAHATA